MDVKTTLIDCGSTRDNRESEWDRMIKIYYIPYVDGMNRMQWK